MNLEKPTSIMMIMKVSEIISFFVASTMIISTSSTVIVAGGAHWYFPVLLTPSAMSTITTDMSTAPAGTRWISRGSVSPVVSHIIFCIWLTGHWSFAAGLVNVARARAEKLRRSAERND